MHLSSGVERIHSAALRSGASPSAAPSHLFVCESNPMLLKSGTLFLARIPHFPSYPWVSWPRAAPGSGWHHLRGPLPAAGLCDGM